MKKEVLQFLKAADGFVSGQEICEALGVSRTAIWKYINALREEGYEIESVTRRGYRLLQSPDLLNYDEIMTALAGDSYAYPVQVFQDIDSTNEEAKRQAAKGAADRTVYVADHQTAGKGRRGRSWISPKGEDIFLSILLRPNIPTECASMLTLVAALAGVEACEDFSKEDCQIKWPNDIILHDHKLCGILTEMSVEMNEISYVVIGIGFNLNRIEFDPEIAVNASSLYKETGKKVDRAAFLASYMRAFWKRYDQFLLAQNLAPFLEEYNGHLINIGRQVRLVQQHQEEIRTALGINEYGELIVQDEEGNKENIFSGEVSVRGLYGYV